MTKGTKDNSNKEYEKDLDNLKEQILKDGDTLVSKRDLLERFCDIDKEYNGRPWNLLQILSNINILIGEESSEDCVSRTELKKWLDMNFSFGGATRKLEFFGRLDKELPPVTSAQKWIPITYRNPTQEEKDYYYAHRSEELCYVVENEMPLDGQEVLVSCGGIVSLDTFDEDYYDFEGIAIEDVDAWMPLPKPYKGK